MTTGVKGGEAQTANPKVCFVMWNWGFRWPVSDERVYAPLASQTSIDEVIKALAQEGVEIDPRRSEQYLAYQTRREDKPDAPYEQIRETLPLDRALTIDAGNLSLAPSNRAPNFPSMIAGYTLGDQDVGLTMLDWFREIKEGSELDIPGIPRIPRTPRFIPGMIPDIRGTYQGARINAFMTGKYIDGVDLSIDPLAPLAPVIRVIDSFFSYRTRGDDRPIASWRSGNFLIRPK